MPPCRPMVFTGASRTFPGGTPAPSGSAPSGPDSRRASRSRGWRRPGMSRECPACAARGPPACGIPPRLRNGRPPPRGAEAEGCGGQPQERAGDGGVLQPVFAHFRGREDDRRPRRFPEPLHVGGRFGQRQQRLPVFDDDKFPRRQVVAARSQMQRPDQLVQRLRRNRFRLEAGDFAALFDGRQHIHGLSLHPDGMVV